jgi:predicted metalloprotease
MKPAMAVGGGGLGVLLLALLFMFLGDDKAAQQLLEQGQVGVQQQQQPGDAPPQDDKTREFIEVVLRDTETIWDKLFRESVQGGRYQPPQLDIFSGSTQSACGTASAEVGPFYCPGDRKIYIDPTFFDQLARRHRAPGDFAQAYVIAHEVAHHVQVLLGFSDQVNQVRQQGSKEAARQAAVRLELQADFLAGVWAHHAHKEYGILEEGDIAEAITAANQIGDDTLMKESIGYVIPERFTHGSSEQRVRWFTRGLKSGDLNDCQTLFDLDFNELVP